jgi:putative transposase
LKSKCRVIEQAAREYPVRLVCQLLQVSPVSYYRSLKEVKPADQGLAEKVAAVFWRHSRRYGVRRIQAELKAEGTPIGRDQIRRLMREQGLKAIQPRSFVPRTTDSRHHLGYAENLLLGMKLPPDRPQEVVVGDITYLPLQSGGFCYLATWTDLFSRLVIGWEVMDKMQEELVTRAFTKAIRRRGQMRGAIVHSDRGGQYAALKFRALMRANGCRQSMSRAGESYDNAYAESLFSRYKAELLEGGAFADLEEARMETFNYIDGYYNRIRRHSGLGYMSPEEYERKYVEERERKLGEEIDTTDVKGIKAKQLLCNNF